MDTKERIVSLRLIAKAKRHPTFARTIGVMYLNGYLSKGGKENESEGNSAVGRSCERDPGHR